MKQFRSTPIYIYIYIYGAVYMNCIYTATVPPVLPRPCFGRSILGVEAVAYWKAP